MVWFDIQKIWINLVHVHPQFELCKKKSWEFLKFHGQKGPMDEYSPTLIEILEENLEFNEGI